jgi:hypothetical protein
MSDKCRGTYTIVGEDAVALVKKLNELCDKDDVIYYQSLLGDDWEGGDNGQAVYFDMYFDHLPIAVKDGKAEFYASTRWGPPVDALTALSKEFDVEIELKYSLECYRWYAEPILFFEHGTAWQRIDDPPMLPPTNED